MRYNAISQYPCMKSKQWAWQALQARWKKRDPRELVENEGASFQFGFSKRAHRSFI